MACSTASVAVINPASRARTISDVRISPFPFLSMIGCKRGAVGKSSGLINICLPAVSSLP